MEKKVKITMNDGKEKFLADLTQVDVASVKLTEKDGKSYLSMKSEVVSETPSHWVERRLYKWNVMPTLVMYDVKYGKTLDQLKADLSEATVYAHAMRDFIIGQDKVHNGIVGESQADPMKNINKAVAALIAKGVPQAEAQKLVAMTEAALKKAGFGK